MITPTTFLADQDILSSGGSPANPLVSVILPTFNRAREGLLARAIASVLAQTFTDFELLVMDDGSRDGSFEIIEQFRKQDPRLIHVRHEINSGLPALRVNEGIELAQGKYLAFQFDDDCWRPEALAGLVSEARQQTNPSVIIGKARVHSGGGQIDLPLVKLDMVSLVEQNRFANNSVLFERSLVERFGMYDPHIGMRRLCDWDLWLRLIRHVPFIVIEQIVADVFESTPGAIGREVPWDIALFRFLHSIERNHLLTPDRWRDVPLDALQIAGVDIPGELRRRLYENQIVPFYFRRRQLLAQPGGFPATLRPERQAGEGRKTVLYTKQSYDVTNEISLANFDRAATEWSGRQAGGTPRDGSYKLYYSILDEVRPSWPGEADLLLLVRTVEQKALELARQALEVGRPVGLYLDDDLFSVHEYGPQFSYLAPGTPYYQNLADLAALTDVVWVTNAAIGESVYPFTARQAPYNGSVLDSELPLEIRQRSMGEKKPLRIGYVGTNYRQEEFRAIWDGLRRIADEYRGQVEFEFWGIDLSNLTPLAAPVRRREFTFSYAAYLQALREADFDILLAPLLDHPRPRLGKSYIKYYETAVAGALGIFSDVPQYQRLPGGLTCLKAGNTSEEWYRALRQAIEMAPEEFDRLRMSCLAHVREEYTARAQLDLHEAALRSIEFHALTRRQRQMDGRPRILYVLHSIYQGGAEIQLWRRLRLVRSYGIEPVVLIPQALMDTGAGKDLRQALAAEGLQLEGAHYTCFTEPRSPQEFQRPEELEDLRQVIQRCNPVLVHSVTFIPALGQVCQELGLPHVNTLYAVEDEFDWGSPPPVFRHCTLVQSDCWRYARRWSELLGGVAKVCSRDMAPEALFELGQRRALESGAPRAIDTWRMVATGTFQERKQQLETIEALGRLKQAGLDNFQVDFYGYTRFFPDYVERCRQSIRQWGLDDRVLIHDFQEDITGILAGTDLLLSLSTYESFPGSIKDALAAGVLVVATPVGGVAEIINDGVSGILCTGTDVPDLMDGIRRAMSLAPEERQRIVEVGRQIARLELHPYRAANDLLRMYTLAIELERRYPGNQLATAGDELPAGAWQSPVREHDSRVVALPVQQAGVQATQRLKVIHPVTLHQGIMVVGHGLSYRFTPSRDQWSGVGICLASIHAPSGGMLKLSVRSPSGAVLRQSCARLVGKAPGDWLAFHFQPLRNSAGTSFTLEFSTQVEGGVPGSILTGSGQLTLGLFQSTPRSLAQRVIQRTLRELGFKLQGGNIYCQEYYVEPN